VALTRESVLDYLANALQVDTSALEDATPLFSSSLLDSFSMVDLVVFLEKEGGFRMRPAEVNLDNLDSVARILAFAARRAEG
jgi:acyl carrier protein